MSSPYPLHPRTVIRSIQPIQQPIETTTVGRLVMRQPIQRPVETNTARRLIMRKPIRSHLPEPLNSNPYHGNLKNLITSLGNKGEYEKMVLVQELSVYNNEIAKMENILNRDTPLTREARSEYKNDPEDSLETVKEFRNMVMVDINKSWDKLSKDETTGEELDRDFISEYILKFLSLFYLYQHSEDERNELLEDLMPYAYNEIIRMLILFLIELNIVVVHFMSANEIMRKVKHYLYEEQHEEIDEDLFGIIESMPDIPDNMKYNHPDDF